jgi:hypothetical protein
MLARLPETDALRLRILLVRPPVGQALALDASRSDLSAHQIIVPKFDAVAVAEIEFRQIAVQVLFLAVLVDALHSALEDRIVAFDRVGVDHMGLAVANIRTLVLTTDSPRSDMVGQPIPRLGPARPWFPFLIEADLIPLGGIDAVELVRPAIELDRVPIRDDEMATLLGRGASK